MFQPKVSVNFQSVLRMFLYIRLMIFIYAWHYKVICTHTTEVDIVLSSTFELAGDLAEDWVATSPSGNEPRAAALPALMLILYTQNTEDSVNMSMFFS